MGHHSLSLSSLLQRWKVILPPLAVATQAQIVVPRVLVAHQRPISAAQVKPAAQRRWNTSARGEPSAAARQTAASNANVMVAPAAAKGRRAVKKSVDCDFLSSRVFEFQTSCKSRLIL